MSAGPGGGWEGVENNRCDRAGRGRLVRERIKYGRQGCGSEYKGVSRPEPGAENERNMLEKSGENET